MWYLPKKAIEDEKREQLRIPTPPSDPVNRKEGNDEEKKEKEDQKRGYAEIDFTINLDI